MVSLLKLLKPHAQQAAASLYLYTAVITLFLTIREGKRFKLNLKLRLSSSLSFEYFGGFINNLFLTVLQRLGDDLICVSPEILKFF